MTYKYGSCKSSERLDKLEFMILRAFYAHFVQSIHNYFLKVTKFLKEL